MGDDVTVPVRKLSESVPLVTLCAGLAILAELSPATKRLTVTVDCAAIAKERRARRVGAADTALTAVTATDRFRRMIRVAVMVDVAAIVVDRGVPPKPDAETVDADAIAAERRTVRVAEAVTDD